MCAIYSTRASPDQVATVADPTHIVWGVSIHDVGNSDTDVRVNYPGIHLVR